MINLKNFLKKNGLKFSGAIGIIFIMACSFGSVQVRDYYLISYKPVSIPTAGSKRPYPFALQVGRIEIQRIFNRQNILYRFSPNQIQYYEFQHWAVRPDFMITDMVLKHLGASNITNRVDIDFLETRPDFRLDGMLDALEKYDAGDLFFAHLAMSFKLFNVSNGSQIWDYSFDERKQVFQQEMVYTVRGLSSILQNQMDIVVSQLDSLFLSMDSGQPFKIQEKVITGETPEKPDSEKTSPDDLDESLFEIIPEK